MDNLNLMMTNWHKTPAQIIGPEHAYIREEIIQDTWRIDRYAVKDGSVLIQGDRFRILFQPDQVTNGLFWIDAVEIWSDPVERDRCKRFHFWISKTVLKGLGQRLRALPGWRRVPFDELFHQVTQTQGE